jgi:hypothetical protein
VKACGNGLPREEKALAVGVPLWQQGHPRGGEWLFGYEGLRQDYRSALHPLRLQRCMPRLLRDRHVVLAAVRQQGSCLQWAHVTLQDDLEVATAAVTQDGTAIGFCSERLRNDRCLVMLAVQQTGLALEYVGPHFRADRQIVLAAVTSDGSVLQIADAALRGDREIVCAAVNSRGMAYRWTSAQRHDSLAHVPEHPCSLIGLALQFDSDKSTDPPPNQLASQQPPARPAQPTTFRNSPYPIPPSCSQPKSAKVDHGPPCFSVAVTCVGTS